MSTPARTRPQARRSRSSTRVSTAAIRISPGQVAPGANCLTGVCLAGGLALDDNGHGTVNAGAAAAAANNERGIAGVAHGARLIPVKVLSAAGTGTYAAIAAGIIWAADNGAKVINLCLGGTASSRTLCDAVTYALDQGVFVDAASGI